MIRSYALVLFVLIPFHSGAATIYFCKNPSGGTFWSSGQCRDHGAFMDRMVTVPDGMPFDQQVVLGEQNRANAAALTAPPQAPVVQYQQAAQPDKQAECKALEAKIANIEALARRPQSGPTQDALANEKKKARDRQFQIRC
jgi:hypothetical protein